MIITTDLIKSLNPCKDRLDNFLTQYGHYWQGTHREFAALDNITYEDKKWVLERVHIQKFGVMPGAHIILENILCLLDNCDEQEAAKPKDAPIFQVGDIVEWCDVRGVVENTSGMSSYVQCKFGDIRKQTFTSDGKLCTWHIVPSLKLIERPKKKVKRYKVLFQDGVDFVVSLGRYKSEEDFRMSNINKLFIQLIKESEIEVEE